MLLFHIFADNESNHMDFIPADLKLSVQELKLQDGDQLIAVDKLQRYVFALWWSIVKGRSKVMLCVWCPVIHIRTCSWNLYILTLQGGETYCFRHGRLSTCQSVTKSCPLYELKTIQGIFMEFYTKMKIIIRWLVEFKNSNSSLYNFPSYTLLNIVNGTVCHKLRLESVVWWWSALFVILSAINGHIPRYNQTTMFKF